MSVVNSAVRELQSHGYHLVYVPIDESNAWKDILLGGQIDGALVFQELPDNVRKALDEKELPLVMLGDNSDPTVSQVVIDDFAGAYAATKHLGGLGHEKIMLYVHDTIKPHCSIGERKRGFEKAMEDMGLESTATFLHAAEEDASHCLVHGNSRPTAVICYSNLEATLLVHAMWQYGVSIPKELSIIGFNDIFATKYMTPPLTTVGFDAGRIGVSGARMVVEEIDGGVDGKSSSAAPQVEVIKPKLIVRGSTAPVQ
jgi:LacI family transcriptional regulator